MLLLQPVTETVQIATLQDKQKGNINSKHCRQFAYVTLPKTTKNIPVPLVCVCLLFEAISQIFYATSDSHDKGIGEVDRCKDAVVMHYKYQNMMSQEIG